MVAIRQVVLPLENKKVYICFILVLVLLAASPIRATEIAGAAAPPSGAMRQTFVVRVDSRTGKLVRRELMPPIPKAPRIAPAAITTLVDQSARAHGVDPLLVQSVIQVESNYDQYAVSPKGAEGLMQLMPGTSRMLGVSNTFDPGQNIEAGVRYLRYLQDLYKDDRLALAAYNAGPGSVEKFKSIPPFPETRKYVEKVGQRYGQAKAAAKVDPPQTGMEAAKTEPVPQEERYSKLEQFVDEDGRLHLQTTP
jgi:soluble lytic murein transglycosylase-like protein